MAATSAVSVKLTAEEKQRLAVIAKKTKRSAHYIMREALLQQMTHMEAELGFLAEAESAWKDYKTTGRYISAEAMEKWAAAGGGKLPSWEQ